jgi:transposase-like protein
MKNTNEYKYNICPECKKPMDWDDSESYNDKFRFYCKSCNYSSIEKPIIRLSKEEFYILKAALEFHEMGIDFTFAQLMNKTISLMEEDKN